MINIRSMSKLIINLIYSYVFEQESKISFVSYRTQDDTL